MMIMIYIIFHVILDMFVLIFEQILLNSHYLTCNIIAWDLDHPTLGSDKLKIQTDLTNQYRS